MIIRQREDYPLTGSFKSHPSLPSPEAQKLIPRLQLPRSCLPLAYLDPLGGQDGLSGSKLFSAHIEVLEEIVHKDRPSNQPTVLIAQSAIDNRLFAIERVPKGIYAMCRLVHWVSVNTLERLRTVTVDNPRPEKRRRQDHPRFPGDNWWSTVAFYSRSETRYKQGKESGVEKTCGVRLCLQRAQQKATTPTQITHEISQPALQNQSGNVLTDMVEEAAQDPEEVLKMIRAQYQEALYASKVGHFSCTSIGLVTDCILSRH